MDNIVTFSFAVQLWESLEKRDNKQRMLPRPLSFFENFKKAAQVHMKLLLCIVAVVVLVVQVNAQNNRLVASYVNTNELRFVSEVASPVTLRWYYENGPFDTPVGIAFFKVDRAGSFQ